MSSTVEFSLHSVDAARAHGDAGALADALLRHANVLAREGRLAEATAAIDEAAAIHRTRGDAIEEARTLLVGATARRLQGQFDAAATSANAALALMAQQPREQAAAHAELGEIELARGDAVAAMRAFDEAIAIGPDAAARWRGRAKAHALAGRFEDAAADLGTAARLDDEAGDTAGALRATIEAATAWQHARRFDRAESLVHAARPRAAATGDEEALAGLALLSATHALEQGQPQAARAHADAARTHALASRAPTAYIGAAVALSRIDERMGDRPAAYGALATGWATLGDLLGPELARATFEPLLRRLRTQWGAQAFDAARQSYEAARRAAMNPARGGEGDAP